MGVDSFHGEISRSRSSRVSSDEPLGARPILLEHADAARPAHDRAARRLGILLTQVNKVLDWSRSSSLWPATFGLACCAIEMMSASASRWDISRFGAEVFRASPRQADLMIVAGRLSVKMAPVLRRIYDQMPEPKWVLSMGACASCGGVFNNYAIVQGVDKVVPVDVYVPGCPPTPDMLLHGLNLLQEKIRAHIPNPPDPLDVAGVEVPGQRGLARA